MKTLVLLLAAPLACAQFALFEMQGSAERPLGPILDFGAISAGSEKSIRFRIRNIGTARATVHTLQVRGAGFSMPGGLAPFDLAPAQVSDFLIRFSATSPADYSATLQVNATTVFLVARVSPSPELTVFPLCTATGANTIDFGTIARGEQRLCNFQLLNPSAESIVIDTFTVTGAAFSSPAIAVPFTLVPGQAQSFTIRFAPALAGSATGTLTVQTRTYELRGNAIDPPLPRPIIDYGSAPLASAQQRTLTVRLPSPAPYSASGQLDMTFLPDPVNAPGDPAIAFLPSLSRTLQFTVALGSTDLLLAGAPSVIFQTGTTAGRIRFTLSGPPRGFTSDPTTLITIPAAPIALESAAASRKGAALEVSMTAFDNTYTSGSMAFRFFDTQGNPMGDAIPADFTAAFRQFFAALAGGSAYKITVAFPVTGDASRIGAVEADLANSAGVTRTQRLSFSASN